MSNQVEQIRAEVERRIKSWAAGVKYEGDAGDCQSRVTELTDLKKFIDSLPAEENPILVPESKETTIEAEQPIQGSIAPEADLEAEIERYESEIHGFEGSSRDDCLNIARHFAEWKRKRTLDKVVEWMKANLTYTHPRKGVETCMVNIPAFLDTMNEENT